MPSKSALTTLVRLFPHLERGHTFMHACLPAPSGRVSLPFSFVTSMSLARAHARDALARSSDVCLTTAIRALRSARAQPHAHIYWEAVGKVTSKPAWSVRRDSGRKPAHASLTMWRLQGRPPPPGLGSRRPRQRRGEPRLFSRVVSVRESWCRTRCARSAALGRWLVATPDAPAPWPARVSNIYIRTAVVYNRSRAPTQHASRALTLDHLPWPAPGDRSRWSPGHMQTA